MRFLYNWRHFAGIFILVLVAGGYVYLLYIQGEHTGFLARQFKEASQRTGLETSFLDTLLGVISVPLNLIKLLLPWSMFILLIFRKGMIKRVRENKLVLFAVFFILINLPLYWFTGDFKPRYIYPLIPFFCIILSYFYVIYLSDFPKTIRVIEVLFGIGIVLFPIGIITSFFIPQFTNIEINHLITILLILTGSGLSYFYYLKHKLRIYLVIFLLIIGRIAMNNIYLPLYKSDSRTTYYKSIVKDIMTITEGETIYMTGEPNVYNSSIQFGANELISEKVITSPILAFQIPYYITKQNENIILFEEEIKPDRYYLIDKLFLKDNNLSILYEYKDLATSHSWCLTELDELHYPGKVLNQPE